MASNNNNNPLCEISKTATWISDGPEGSISLTFDADEAAASGITTIITMEASQRGIPFNVRLYCNDDDDEAMSSSSLSSSYCFELEIVEATKRVSVGVCTKTDFGPGWKGRGTFHNGNVANGAAALTASFGDVPQAGDTVGVAVVMTKNATTDSDKTVVSVIFYLKACDVQRPLQRPVETCSSFFGSGTGRVSTARAQEQRFCLYLFQDPTRSALPVSNGHGLTVATRASQASIAGRRSS